MGDPFGLSDSEYAYGSSSNSDHEDDQVEMSSEAIFNMNGFFDAHEQVTNSTFSHPFTKRNKNTKITNGLLQGLMSDEFRTLLTQVACRHVQHLLSDLPDLDPNLPPINVLAHAESLSLIEVGNYHFLTPNNNPKILERVIDSSTVDGKIMVMYLYFLKFMYDFC